MTLTIEEKLSFAHGNLACSTHHKPTRAAFRKLARELGMTSEAFEAWADARQWWDEERSTP